MVYNIYKNDQGYSLIELLVFIVVSGLLMSTILMGMMTAVRSLPQVHNQWVAIQAVRGCMEGILEQRRLLGYNIYTCPSTTTPAICTAPAGFTFSTTISCSSWNSDAYKTINVAVSGLANATLSVQIGDF